MPQINEYKDALYDVKRNFLIIGLTGYTGSGCSESRMILESSLRPTIPNFEVTQSNTEAPTCTSFSKDHVRCPNIQMSARDRRIYDKLSRTWNRTEWEPFIPIKISTIIFIFGLYKSLTDPCNRPIIKYMRELANTMRIDAKDIERYWIVPYSNDERNTAAIIDIYRTAQEAYKQFKKKYGGNNTKLSRIMQNFGDQIRKFGTILPTDAQASPKNLFILPEAIRRLVKSYYWTRKKSGDHGPFHFVIDAFRNPIEVEYFKWRYSEFYLVGILRDEKDRKGTLEFSDRQFLALSKREKGELFNKSRNKAQKLLSSQNVYECLQKADIFIENVPGERSTFSSLKYHLIKLISLAKSPGCIPPTKDERNMQIAMTGKQMSGCISRQVGATLATDTGYVIGIGWNDPPSGQTPCSLRTGKELVNGGSPTVFSKFERDVRFVKHIEENFNLELPFCFRSELSALERGSKRNEFTRALHAEENALFQAVARSSGNISGSTLYTTSRTCTLCAKKAYQLGVSRICYIEEYTDIAIEQTLMAGERHISINRFQGIVGASFFKLFSSLIPEKDLIQLYMRSDDKC